MTSLSIGLALTAATDPTGAAPVISANILPAVQAVQPGDMLADTLHASATQPQSYTSNGGTITVVVAEWSVDDGAWCSTETEIVRPGEVIAARVTVSDSAGNVYTFYAGTTTVPALAPVLAASAGLSGRVLTIVVDSQTGTPTPSVALSALTLDGANVLAEATGAGPWSYTIPDGTTSQTVTWEVTASNLAGNATASGSETIAANLAAPEALAGPALVPATPTPGDTVTIAEGSYSGTPAPTVTGTLTLAGVDVTTDISGRDYTVPPGTPDGAALVWNERASNGVDPEITQQVSATVMAEAWDINTDAGQIAILASAAPAAPAAPDVSGGNKEILIGEAA